MLLHEIVLGILGLTGVALLAAVVLGRDPLADTPTRTRRLIAFFWAVFFLSEIVDVWVGRSQVPALLTAWALAGLVMALVGLVLILTRIGNRGHRD